MNAAPCLVCGAELENLDEPHGNQPSGGLEFITHGHYGSSMFDPMDGTFLVANICDACLNDGYENGRLLHGTPRVVRNPKPKLVPWRKALGAPDSPVDGG